MLEEFTLEQEAQDVLAVLDAAGSERAALLTYSVGGLVGALLAAEQPRAHRRAGHVRVGRAHLLGAGLRLGDDGRAARGVDRAQHRRVGRRRQPVDVAVLAPSVADDPALAAWFARMQRLSASPSEARIISRAMVDLDVRHVLPQIRVPTLVMHRPNELVWDVRHSRYLAEHIPGARYVELEGVDSFPFIGDSDAILEEIEEFLTGGRAGGELARALLTVMFTDIVDATAHAARLGDGRWRDLLARHDEEVRKELAALRRPRGQDRRRRLPGDVRRAAVARAALRAGDHPSRRASWASRCASASTPASAS